MIYCHIRIFFHINPSHLVIGDVLNEGVNYGVRNTFSRCPTLWYGLRQSWTSVTREGDLGTMGDKPSWWYISAGGEMGAVVVDGF